MKFDCDDSAYEFYKDYAYQIGFSVWKQFVKRGNMGQVIRRIFCFPKEGERVLTNTKVHCLISQVGCLAQMTC